MLKKTPITERPGKKTIYAIGDNFFRFWYRFVPQNTSAISAGKIQSIYPTVIAGHYPEYMGHIFEEMCREYLFLYAEEVEIDVVGTPAEGSEYIIGSCKYRNTPRGC